MRFRHFFAILAITLLLPVTSCGPDANTSWIHRDNTVRVRLPADIKTLNPFLYRTGYESTVLTLIFQGPMDFDPESLALTPLLVKSPAVVEDITEGPNAGGQRFAFEIREEATWDDGQPVTAADFEFTLKALFNPSAPTQRWLAYLDYLADIELDADNTKRFTVITNRKYFLAEAAISTIALLPRHVYDPDNSMAAFSLSDLAARSPEVISDPRLQEYATLFASPKYDREVVSGSGPYRLSEWTDAQRVVLTRKANWWGDAATDRSPLLRAFPDTLIFLPIPDQTAASIALQNQDVDVALELDSRVFIELQNNSALQQVYNFYTPPRFVFFYIPMNTKNPKLSDKRVRRALAHTLDVDQVIEFLYDGFGERIVGPFLPDKPYYHTGLAPIQQDLEKARTLLSEAGWEDSDGNGFLDKEIDGKRTELSLDYLYSPGSTFQERLSNLLFDNARQVGIRINPVQVESNVLGERLRNRDFELAGRGAGASPVHDDPKQLFHTESDNPGGTNYSRFGTPQTDSLIEAIRGTNDEAERERLYLRFQEIIYEEQPMIFLFAPLDKIVVHKRFKATITRNRPGVSLVHLKRIAG